MGHPDDEGGASETEAVNAYELTRDGDETLIKVRHDANPKSLAAAISFTLADSKKVVLRSVGAGAVNQAVKACAIARGLVATRGVDLLLRPGFQTVQGDRGPVSAVVLYVEVR